VLRERGQLGLRAVKYFNKKYLDSALFMGLRAGVGDDWLRIGGLKLFVDGSLGARTALMIAPYDGEPNNRGLVVVPKDDMLRMIRAASLNGLPSAVHAIGDQAVRDVLDVFAVVRADEAAAGIPHAARRHRIEHVQLIDPADVNRLAELEIVASMQPIHATSDYLMADHYWGARVPYSYNPRLQLDRGVTVAFGSDAPFDHIGPIIGIHAAVTRQRANGAPEGGWNPAACVTVDEALRAYTVGAAYAGGMEGIVGRLAPGYAADCVVLSRDPYTTPAEELLSIAVQATMVGGVWRFGE
jgi:hypothetical protein